jgi:endoribonuclease Nob1
MRVFDSSALFKSFDLRDSATIPDVFAEVKNRPTLLRLENAVAAGSLQVLEPGEDAIKKVQAAVSKTNDRLSPIDVKLIALAIELNATLMTDDFGMQNICLFLGLPFQGIDRTISHLFKRVFFCPSCKKYFSKEGSCSSCGAALVSKVSSAKKKQIP